MIGQQDGSDSIRNAEKKFSTARPYRDARTPQRLGSAGTSRCGRAVDFFCAAARFAHWRARSCRSLRRQPVAAPGDHDAIARTSASRRRNAPSSLLMNAIVAFSTSPRRAKLRSAGDNDVRRHFVVASMQWRTYRILQQPARREAWPASLSSARGESDRLRAGRGD